MSRVSRAVTRKDWCDISPSIYSNEVGELPRMSALETVATSDVEEEYGLSQYQTDVIPFAYDTSVLDTFRRLGTQEPPRKRVKVRVTHIP